jgi:predicted transposase YbfD/YdcC
MLEIRYYTSSCNPAAQSFKSSIRDHWKIEDSLHRVPEVNFREHHQKKRNGQSAYNFNTLSKTAMAFFKKIQKLIRKPA